MSAILERYKTRLNESNAMKEEKSEYYNFDCSVCKRVTRHWDVFGDMSKLKCNSCGEYRTLETEEKSDWRKEIEEYHNAMMRNERNNGREDVYSQIRDAFKPDDAFKGRIYFDDAEDFINVLKIRLGKK